MLLHLDLHEYNSKVLDEDNDPPPPDIYEFTWFRRTVDDTARWSDRRAGQQGDIQRPDGRTCATVTQDGISAMRDLFKLDDVQATGVEDALIDGFGYRVVTTFTAFPASP